MLSQTWADNPVGSRGHPTCCCCRPRQDFQLLVSRTCRPRSCRRLSRYRLLERVLSGRFRQLVSGYRKCVRSPKDIGSDSWSLTGIRSSKSVAHGLKRCTIALSLLRGVEGQARSMLPATAVFPSFRTSLTSLSILRNCSQGQTLSTLLLFISVLR